jgi:hypothetical protein
MSKGVFEGKICIKKSPQMRGNYDGHSYTVGAVFSPLYPNAVSGININPRNIRPTVHHPPCPVGFDMPS